MSIRMEFNQGCCPKCGNDTIYKKSKYKFPYRYKYTIEECKIGKPYCDYKSKINENTGEILETNNPDKKFSRNKKINQILN